jgi:hypothetical protein
MPIKHRSILLLFLNLIIITQVYGQEFIYRITVDQKKVLTGFKLAGQRGIVTTLHGVASYKRITVASMNANVLYDDQVKIAYFDLAKNVCIISSASIDAIPQASGLRLSPVNPISRLNGANVVIKGFPLSVPQYQTINATLDGDHGLEHLSNLLPAGGSRAALAKRRSPDIDQSVINLHGNIYPGHSGSPILYNNEVIGIVDGGLLVGPGYAWGIVYNEVNFTAFNNVDPGYLNILSTNNALFSSEPTYSSAGENDNLPDPSERPVSVLSVAKHEDGTLDFHLLNESPVDLDVYINVRYYEKDLTEILDEGSYGISPLPAGQKGHIRTYAPIHIKNFDCVQYDISINNYPRPGIEYKKRILVCDFN